MGQQVREYEARICDRIAHLNGWTQQIEKYIKEGGNGMRCDVCGKKVNGKTYQLEIRTKETSSSPTVIRQSKTRRRTYNLCDDCVQTGSIQLIRFFQ